MGGEGSMSAANQSLKMNRKGLRSKRIGYKDNYSSQTLSSKKIIDKKVSEEELTSIKTEIRKNAQQLRKKRLIIFSICLFITALISYLIFD